MSEAENVQGGNGGDSGVSDNVGDSPEKGPKEKEVPAAQLIPVGKDGQLEFKNHIQLVNYCSYMIKSGMVPDRFDTAPKLFGALMYVRDLGLPQTAIRQVANIHGTPSIFGDLPLALARRSGQLASFREEWFDEDYKEICFENKNLNSEVYGAVCFLARVSLTAASGSGPEKSFSYTLDDAKSAGLYPGKFKDGNVNPNAPWNKYTKMMMRYKARAIGLKSMLPDVLNGISIAEYDHDEIPEKDVTPIEVEAKENFSERLERLVKESYKDGTSQ